MRSGKQDSCGAPRPLLSRLARDKRGNTLAIVAAAMFPMLAMIGSGIDMSRAYMAQNRLRQACDAGALAGRRLLSGPTVTTAIKDETKKYFNFNFPQRMFETETFDITPTITVPTTGTVKVTAATRMPTTIMKLFGFSSLPISATCAATQDFVNTDIALVLDLSGSMNCPPGVAGGCSPEQTNSKLGALRAAANSLYDTLEEAQDQLHSNNLRLRYGFVTYNSSVNVGRQVYAKNASYMATTAQYQSRWPTYPIDAAPYGINTASACATAYTQDAAARSLGYTGVFGGYWNRPRTNGCLVFGIKNGAETEHTFGKTPSGPVAGTVPWNAPWNVTGLLTSTTSNPFDASYYIGTPDIPRAWWEDSKIKDQRPLPIMSVWNGCIEERQTNNTLIDGGTATIAPADAYDLDIDKIPDSDATRWKPMWPEVEYNRDGTHPSSSCPTESRRLTEYYGNQASFNNYVAALRGDGGTYHDLGIIWGARFLSSGGIFKSATPQTNDQFDPDNPEKIRGFSVKKYMIFMTDGDMQPQTYIYSSYGLEQLDGRVMGSPSNDENALKLRHLQRFRMACNAAKSRGINIWVIAFSTTLTADMENCATVKSQASGLSTQAQLIAKFKEIGSKIGSLRLSQ